MKPLKLTLIALFVFLLSCQNNQYKLSPVNSESFAEAQVEINFALKSAHADSLAGHADLLATLDQTLQITDLLPEMEADNDWDELINRWIILDKVISPGNTLASENLEEHDNSRYFSPEVIEKWARINSGLLKFSGEVRFADALEKIVYGNQGGLFPENLLKSVVYTHLFDKVYINIIGNSAVSFQHTTGGNVKLIQETKYPDQNIMILKIECPDKRFLDVNIRIPSWAENPTVTHGHVKYVSRPGEYCQIMRKWRNGDEFMIVLKN